MNPQDNLPHSLFKRALQFRVGQPFNPCRLFRGKPVGLACSRPRVYPPEGQDYRRRLRPRFENREMETFTAGSQSFTRTAAEPHSSPHNSLIHPSR
jgi:hypothetical protein